MESVALVVKLIKVKSGKLGAIKQEHSCSTFLNRVFLCFPPASPEQQCEDFKARPSFLGQVVLFSPPQQMERTWASVQRPGKGGGLGLILDTITHSRTVHDSQERRGEWRGRGA